MMQRRHWMKGTLVAAGGAWATAAGWPRLGMAQSGTEVNRIGLLLPKLGKSFERASAALKAGIEAGFRQGPKGYAIDIYETDESPKQLTAAYHGMLRRGTSLVIGPLTRKGTAAIAGFSEVPITTLALNQFDGDGSVPWNVLVFSIGVEQEGMQMADLAFQSMRKRAGSLKAPKAVIITAANPIGRRAASVFHAHWLALGGDAELPIELEESALYKFRGIAKREQGDLYFLSMPPHLARPVRMIIGKDKPMFGTSQISIGGPQAKQPIGELDGIRLVEMPAILDPGIVSAQGFAKPPEDFSLEMQRLYALGIDALRVGREMFMGSTSIDLDGLTGKLRYDGSYPVLERTLLPAEYKHGVPMPV
ncbi:MAG: penicillin-binding protein activator [Lautropia sp.]|nr:penicillin-binding protein activator [Lautropia sp.]